MGLSKTLNHRIELAVSDATRSIDWFYHIQTLIFDKEYSINSSSDKHQREIVKIGFGREIAFERCQSFWEISLFTNYGILQSMPVSSGWERIFTDERN